METDRIGRANAEQILQILTPTKALPQKTDQSQGSPVGELRRDNHREHHHDARVKAGGTTRGGAGASSRESSKSRGSSTRGSRGSSRAGSEDDQVRCVWN